MKIEYFEHEFFPLTHVVVGGLLFGRIVRTMHPDIPYSLYHQNGQLLVRDAREATLKERFSAMIQTRIR